jgi:hypothetical protein
MARCLAPPWQIRNDVAQLRRRGASRHGRSNDNLLQKIRNEVKLASMNDLTLRHGLDGMRSLPRLAPLRGQKRRAKLSLAFSL